VDLSLNRPQRVSEQVLSTLDNNPEGVQPQYKEGQNLRVSAKVYIINMRRKPLMPCNPRKAKKLLRNKKAVVTKRFPFTIKLLVPTGETKQRVTLGIDLGYENIGFSAITQTKELISGTVKLDGKTSERLTEKKMYRRNRRNRLWYRKPRFNNRSKPEGWLPSSVQRRYDTHLNLINRLKVLLPITNIVIETAKFDIQKINNPDIKGVGYQQGNMFEYQNIRSYLMAREKGKCQLCGKGFKGQPSHIHHCKQRSQAGSNRPENLAILHKSCHEKLHKKGLKLSKPKSYKPNIFMSIIGKRFYRDIPNLQVTYGYQTFVKRNKLGLKKTHSTDAFVIAGGTIQERTNTWVIEQKHRHNRAIQLNRKGFKPFIKTHIYKIQPKDLIWIEGKKFSVVGIQNRGSYVKVKDYSKVIPTKKIESIYNFGGFVWN
jgi:hypothetical protein